MSQILASVKSCLAWISVLLLILPKVAIAQENFPYRWLIPVLTPSRGFLDPDFGFVIKSSVDAYACDRQYHPQFPPVQEQCGELYGYVPEKKTLIEVSNEQLRTFDINTKSIISTVPWVYHTIQDVSHDGTLVAVAWREDVYFFIGVKGVKDGTIVLKIPIDMRSSKAIALSWDNKRTSILWDNNVIEEYSLETGLLLHTFREIYNASKLYYSPSGSELLACSVASKSVIISVNSSKRSFLPSISEVAYSNDGKSLVTRLGEVNPRVSFYDTRVLTLLKQYQITGTVFKIGLSYDGEKALLSGTVPILVSLNNGIIQLPNTWLLSTNNLSSLPALSSIYKNLGQPVISTSRLFDVKDLHPLAEFSLDRLLTPYDYSLSRDWVVGTGYDTTSGLFAGLWQVGTGALLRKGFVTPINGASISSDGLATALDGTSGVFSIGDIVNGTIWHSVPHAGRIFSYELSKSGKWLLYGLASGGIPGSLVLYDIDRRVIKWSKAIPAQKVKIANNGLNVAAIRSNGIDVYDFVTGNLIKRLVNSGGVTTFCYLDEGDTILSSGPTKNTVFRISDGMVLHEFVSPQPITDALVADINFSTIILQMNCGKMGVANPLLSELHRFNCIVSRESWLGSSAQACSVKLYRNNSSTPFYYNPSLVIDTSNSLKFDVDTIPLACDIWLKPKGYLSRRQQSVTYQNAEYYASLPIIKGGDVNEDNSVTVIDAAILQDYFGASSEDINWDKIGVNGYKPSDTDIDGDGMVSIFDYMLVVDNLGAKGDS